MRSLSFFLCLVTVQANAQQLFFSKENYTDSIKLADSMPSLAVQVMANYTEADKASCYNNLFRYALVAGQYTASISYLDSFRNLQHFVENVSVD